MLQLVVHAANVRDLDAEGSGQAPMAIEHSFADPTATERSPRTSSG